MKYPNKGHPKRLLPWSSDPGDLEEVDFRLRSGKERVIYDDALDGHVALLAEMIFESLQSWFLIVERGKIIIMKENPDMRLGGSAWLYRPVWSGLLLVDNHVIYESNAMVRTGPFRVFDPNPQVDAEAEFERLIKFLSSIRITSKDEGEDETY